VRTIALLPFTNIQASKENNIKVASFNVSIDTTIYIKHGKVGIELSQLQNNDHSKIKNVA